MRFALLGPLTVLDEAGTRVTVAGARKRILLAALLVHANTVVSVDALAELVWDGAPPLGYPTTLRSHIRRLRAALGPRSATAIVTCEAGYVIRLDESDLDVLRFEALCREAYAAVRESAWQQAWDATTRALALWRAQPLADVSSQTLRDQILPRLGQLRLHLLEQHAEAGLHLGRHDQLIPLLTDLAADHPLRERVHVHLMRALAGAGRQAEALAAYQDARRALVDQLGIEPGPELQRLHQRILAGDTDLLAPADSESTSPRSSTTAATTAAVSRQLPAAPAHFTGRHAELDLLTALVDPATGAAGGAVVISAIDGMAGIGKTALAIHAAHRLAEEFPDGQLFLDLHGYTQAQRPRTAGEALEWLLRALGVPAGRIPKEREQAAALYRQRLAGTRTLIVLDNAATETQVRPLLPGDASCVVIVTSRRRLKGLDDARTLSLALLSPPDAVALLRAVAGADRVPAEDPLLDEIAELCGCLPLALRIAGALLRHRPAWGLEHLAGLLREQRGRVQVLSDGERDLTVVFDLSYTSLDERHRCLWRRLGLVPGPDLDAYAAAALAEADPATATGLLEDLVDQNLLIEYAPGRYRLHDLLRAHAQTLAGVRTGDGAGWDLVAHRPASPELIEAAHADQTLVTRVGRSHADHATAGRPATGVPTSSSTLPGLIVAMLHLLDPRPGQTVLDVGTGSGYCTALLCHRLGDAHVTSVDVDDYLSRAARARLAGLGHSQHPHHRCHRRAARSRLRPRHRHRVRTPDPHLMDAGTAPRRQDRHHRRRNLPAHQRRHAHRRRGPRRHRRAGRLVHGRPPHL